MINFVGRIDNVNNKNKVYANKKGQIWVSLKILIDNDNRKKINKESKTKFRKDYITISGTFPKCITRDEVISQANAIYDKKSKYLISAKENDNTPRYFSLTVVNMEKYIDKKDILSKPNMWKLFFLNKLGLTKTSIDDIRNNEKFQVATNIINGLFDNDYLLIEDQSNIITGMGPSTITKIINNFNTINKSALLNDTDKIYENYKLRQYLSENLNNNYIFTDGIINGLINYFKTEELSNDEIHKLIDKINNNLFYIINLNLPTIGFKKIDKVYLSDSNNTLFDDNRIQAQIKYEYNDFCEKYHSDFIEVDTLLKSMIDEDRLSKEENDKIELCTKKNLIQMTKDEDFIMIKTDKYKTKKDIRLISKENLTFEKNLVKEVKLLSEINDDNMKVKKKSIDEGIKLAEEEQGFKFTKEQKEVIENVLKHNISTINGFAGTGKSSILRAIDKILEINNPHSGIYQCAFTGRAADSLSKSSGYPAKTAHATLQIRDEKDVDNLSKRFSSKDLYNVDGSYVTELSLYDDFGTPTDLLAELSSRVGQPYAGSTIIIDEYSTLNIKLFALLLHIALNYHVRVILIGDSGQLPAINISTDKLINRSPYVCHNNLSKVHRQDNNSEIYEDSLIIRKGMIPNHFYNKLNDINYEENDLKYHIYHNDFASAINRAKSIFFDYLNKGEDINDIVILSPSNKVNNRLNEEIHNEIVNNYVKDKNKFFTLKYFDNKTYDEYQVKVFEGELVINTKNQYNKIKKEIMTSSEDKMSVYNGNIGKIKAIEYDKKGKKYMLVDFGLLGVAKFYEDESATKYLSLAYAITIHKAQGSTIKHVITLISDMISEDAANSFMRRNISRQMIYTAMTRASDTCDIIINQDLMEFGVHKNVSAKNDTLFDIMFNEVNVLKVSPSNALDLNN